MKRNIELCNSKFSTLTFWVSKTLSSLLSALNVGKVWAFYITKLKKKKKSEIYHFIITESSEFWTQGLDFLVTQGVLDVEDTSYSDILPALG